MNRASLLVRGLPRGEMPAISAEALKPHSDLTFRVLDELTVHDANVHHSLLNGCLIRNCTFRGGRFSRCDLEQVQFQDCRFVAVNFQNVELTSAKIAKSRFHNCNFESALISDCTWRDCTIDKCSFQQAVLHGSHFEQCRLIENDLRGASVQLDTFRSSSFERMKLGDCTFLNHLMMRCSYNQVQVNAESIGSLFGISEQDLLSFGLVYLGHKVTNVAATGGLLDSIELDYQQRQWFFMREVLRLNFGRTPPLVGLRACLDALFWPSTLGVPLKVSDITFLEMVILELARQRELPGITALEFPKLIRDFQRQTSRETCERADGARLQQLASRLQGVALHMLEWLTKELEPLAATDRCVRTEFMFSKKPTSDVERLLRSVAEASGLPIRGRTITLDERSGSYVLLLQTTLLTLAALQTGLWLLNGCVVQVVELKARLQLVRQRRPPKVIRDRVLLPDQNIPKWLAVTVQSIFAKLTADPAQLERIASDFSPKNLKPVKAQAAVARGRSRPVADKS